ncbi:RICIN domain-containing protein [Silvanigrella aquatica]|uniref:Ricin B lectin domain-containing protein n=1 Tax=Silvanigrella aquatica TaxID=1915309 RepID=A0A1L4D1P5_9BACT|nr:RICIN domain-containing protein [Silvanigrella aquatica]APJ04110.1 hypothetical protein AXG55_09400 [Silvanigrella aquatica]
MTVSKTLIAKVTYTLVILSLPLAANAFQIIGLGGKCLDVNGGQTHNGTPVTMWDCHGGSNQQWHIENGRITGIGGLCLDVSYGHGSPVQVWDCNNTPPQQWTYNIDGSLRAMGKCLDVFNFSTLNGTPVQMSNCTNNQNQKWRFW